MKKTRRIRRSEATWRELFSRQAASGMRASEFCRREGINKNVFHRWRVALLLRVGAAFGGGQIFERLGRGVHARDGLDAVEALDRRDRDRAASKALGFTLFAVKYI